MKNKPSLTMQPSSAPQQLTWLRLSFALIYLIPLAIFLKLAAEVREREPIGADIAILEWLHSLANPTLDYLMIFFTNTGGPVTIIAATFCAAIALYALRQRRAMSILLIGLGGALAINVALKMTFQRVRPSLWESILPEISFSFPSGHAMMSSALAFSVIYIAWHTKWRWYAVSIGLVYVFIVGLSRIYLGVHYPSDVVGGWAVSFIWLAVVARILARSRHDAPKPR